MIRSAIALALTALVAAPAFADSNTNSPKEMPAVQIKGVRYIGKTVSDIDATLAFYGKGIAVPVVKRYRTKAPKLDPSLYSTSPREIEVAYVRLPNIYLQLIDYDPDRKADPVVRPVLGPGYTHICYISPSSNSAYDKLRAAGLKMVSRGDKPVDIGGYGMVYAYGLDPDGAMIETEVADKPRRPDPFWLGHLANVTPDIDRMTAFYTELLGYGPRRQLKQENSPKLDAIANIDNLSIRGAWYTTPNVELEFWHYARPLTPQHTTPPTLDQLGYNSLSFEVSDLSAEQARLTKAGVHFIGRPLVIDGWKTLYARDPDGNLFALQQAVDHHAGESVESMAWIDRATF